jgi:hypothetical protein
MKTTSERYKTLVLEAFDTLFNKPDCGGGVLVAKLCSAVGVYVAFEFTSIRAEHVT